MMLSLIKVNADKDRIMVRRLAAGVFAEFNLLWSVMTLKFDTRLLVWSPIAVCKYAIGLHAGRGRNEDVVDAAFGI